MDETDGKSLLAYGQSLAKVRAGFLVHWDEVRTFLSPASDSFSGQAAYGAKNRERIYDNYGEGCSDEFVAELHNVLTSGRFFGIRPSDPRILDDEDAALYLDHAVDVMLQVFDDDESGFKSAIMEINPQAADFGTEGLWIEDRPGRVPLFQARALAELYCAEGVDGVIDTTFCPHKFTARQASARWGDACPQAIQDAEAKPESAEQEFTFWHCTFPRNPGEMTADVVPKLARDMPWASVWVEANSGAVVERSGTMEKAMIVARLDKGQTGEVYGRGRGMVALADIKQLQSMQRNINQAGVKKINPSIILPDDGVLSPVSQKANGINYADAQYFLAGRSVVQTMPGGGDIIGGLELKQDIRTLVERAYFLHLIRMSREPRLIARQVFEIARDRIKAMAPYVGRLQVERVGPLVRRTFGILLRAGAFGPVPPILAGAKLKVIYDTPAAMLERVNAAYAIAQAYEMSVPMLDRDKTGELMDNFDTDQAMRILWRENGVPAIVFRDPRKRDAMRAQRSQVLDQQHQMQQADLAAGAMQKFGQGAQALKGAVAPGGAQAGAAGGGNLANAA